MSRKYLVHIVAVDENNAIGKNDELLFRISEDLKQFKRLTMYRKMICGRKTFETLPKLKNRHLYVLTRQKIEPVFIQGNEPADSAVVTHVPSMDHIQAEFNEHINSGLEPVFVIGGGEIYKETLDQVSVVMLTRIHSTVEDVDAWYPDINTLRPPKICTVPKRHKDPSGLEYSFQILGYDSEHLKHFLKFKTEREKDEREKRPAYE